MENQEIISKNKNNKGKIVGFAFLAIGTVLLAKQLGVSFPSWLISWPMFLIVIGIVNYAKDGFKRHGWLVAVFAGTLFLLEEFDPSLSVSKLTWPAIIIAIGLWMLFGRRKDGKLFGGNSKYSSSNFGDQQSTDAYNSNATNNNSSNDYINSVAIFSGTKTSVFSKSFKGGEITSVFGGSEINFAHADINGTVIIETTQVFGGTKIIVPPTWDVVTEISPIFGGVDDNRSLHQVLPDKSKVLLIRGTTVFGGIEIRNF